MEKNENKLSVKIHESYRKIVAICDPELVGKVFKEGNFILELNKKFYEGEKMTEEEVLNLISFLEKDYPSYNIVGERAVKICLKANLISREGIKKIAKIPHAMVF